MEAGEQHFHSRFKEKTCSAPFEVNFVISSKILRHVLFPQELHL